MRLILVSASLGLLTANAPVCRETTYHTNGTVSERTVPDDGTTAASASSSAGGSGRASAHASSSVSASSSSGSGGTSSASVSGDQSRSVTVEREDGACRITITER